MQPPKNFYQQKRGRDSRRIDKSVGKMTDTLKTQFVVASKREISAWKAYLAVLFAAGFFTALILVYSNGNWQMKSHATGEQASMSTLTSFPNHRQNDQFSVTIYLDTALNNIVSALAVATYDPSAVEVLTVDTSAASSDFTYEVYNNIDAQNGKITVGVGKPTPGVNSASAKVAVVTLRALEDFSGAGFSLKFDTSLAVDDCAAILDDGQGTNVLEEVHSAYEVNDTTAPVRSSGSPSGALSAGTSQTTVSLTTNENATCKYSTSAGTAFDAMTGTFTSTGAASHSVTVSGLSSGITYNYYVRCEDNYNNADTDDYLISFSVGSYSGSDLNLDSAINNLDFNILKTDFLKSTSSLSNSRSDINGDGIVTIRDFGIMMSSW